MANHKDKLKELLGKIAVATNTITVEDDISHYTILELVNALRSNVKEVNKVLDNLDGEINGKIKEEVQRLIDDGTLDELINEELLGKIYSNVDALFESQTQIDLQLLQKANADEVVKKGEGSLNDFNEETRALLLGLTEGGTNINAVLGEGNVKNLNLAENSVSFNKLDVNIQEKVMTLNETYTSTSHQKGFINTVGKVEDNNNYHYKILSVNPNQLLYVSCHAKGTNGALAIFCESDGTFISSYKKVSETGVKVYNDEPVLVPGGCGIIKLCSDINTPIIVREKGFIDTVQMRKQLNQINENITGVAYSEIFKEVEYQVGNVDYMGKIQPQYTAYSYKKIPMSEGNVFYVSCYSASTSGALAVFMDWKDSKIRHVNRVSSTGEKVYIDEKIIAPTGCSYVLLCTKNPETYPIVVKKETIETITYESFNELKEAVDSKDISSDWMFEHQQLVERVDALEGLVEFDWKPFDKGYVVIVIDDGRHDLCRFSEIFNEYGVPLSCALMSSGLLSTIQDDGRKLIDVALEIQTNGGEILSHSTSGAVFKEDTTEEVANERFRTSKKVLSDNGLIINGFVKPGGNGALDRLDKFEHLARKYYRYGYSVGASNQFKMSRYAIGNDFSIHQKKLQNCIDKKSLLVFYGHSFDSDEVSESTLRSIIEFVRDNEGIEIVTTKYLYDNFKSTPIENRLIALEEVLRTIE